MGVKGHEEGAPFNDSFQVATWVLVGLSCGWGQGTRASNQALSSLTRGLRKLRFFKIINSWLITFYSPSLCHLFDESSSRTFPAFWAMGVIR